MKVRLSPTWYAETPPVLCTELATSGVGQVITPSDSKNKKNLFHVLSTSEQRLEFTKSKYLFLEKLAMQIHSLATSVGIPY